MRWIVLVLVLSIIACKKTPLEGEKALLIGKWQWYKSYIPGGKYPSSYEYGLPHNIYIEFQEKGRYVLSISGKIKEEGRIVMRTNYDNQGPVIEGGSFSLEYYRTFKKSIIPNANAFFISSDTLRLTNYPLDNGNWYVRTN